METSILYFLQELEEQSYKPSKSGRALRQNFNMDREDSNYIVSQQQQYNKH
jgi:hypothetical protein